jgi:hypothetical protein
MGRCQFNFIGVKISSEREAMKEVTYLYVRMQIINGTFAVPVMLDWTEVYPPISDQSASDRAKR